MVFTKNSQANVLPEIIFLSNPKWVLTVTPINAFKESFSYMGSPLMGLQVLGFDDLELKINSILLFMCHKFPMLVGEVGHPLDTNQLINQQRNKISTLSPLYQTN